MSQRGSLPRQRSLNTTRKDLIANHINSFNALFEDIDSNSTRRAGILSHILTFLPTFEVDSPVFKDRPVWKFSLTELRVDSPSKGYHYPDNKLYPTEAREWGKTYAGRLRGTLNWEYCKYERSSTGNNNNNNSNNNDNDEDLSGTAESSVVSDESECQITRTVSKNIEINFGEIPLMLCSCRCNITNMSSEDLISHREDPHELGGYFIANGNERVIRMLITERRNRLLAIKRGAFKKRNEKYSDYGILIRCVRLDERATTNIFHYIEDGTATLECSVGQSMFLMPLILLMRALKPTTDREIYNTIMQGTNKNLFLSERIELMLRLSQSSGYGRSQKECLSFIGEHFASHFNHFSQNFTKSERIGEHFLDECILIHCHNNDEKFNLIAIAIRKLYSFVQGYIKPDSLDTLDNQEVITPGHIIASMIRLGLHKYLESLKYLSRKEFSTDIKDANDILTNSLAFDSLCKQKYHNDNVVESIVRIAGGNVGSDSIGSSNNNNSNNNNSGNRKRAGGGNTIGDRLAYFLNTGNLPYQDRSFKQKTGWSISADRINYFRFLSHFRAVHRGSYWAEMRTTDVRKLRPESWGFLCPVHTPDGAPCGLLNHLTESAQVLSEDSLHSYQLRNSFKQTLLTIGLIPLENMNMEVSPDFIPVMLNGIFIGYVVKAVADGFVEFLRTHKARVSAKTNVPQCLEIVYVKDGNLKMYPCIDLSTTGGRFVRPVHYLSRKRGSKTIERIIEWISPIEQTLLEIAVIPSDINETTTHVEMNPQNILAVLSQLTPFSDNNQSPRNMYQCQMLKQAMGLHATNLEFRTDNKAYRLQTAQMPIVKNDGYCKYELDDYAAGTNSVVAVISYTGYDMEDAMIICKQSMQRGFKHGTVYVTKVIDLTKYAVPNLEGTHIHFRNMKQDGKLYVPSIPKDGIPAVGTRIRKDDALYVTYDSVKRSFHAARYVKDEECIVEQVRLIDTGHNEPQIITIKLRYNRNPIIGDKFASRAGQKGTLAQLWPQEDMPFTDSGIVPDLIINPHAFPSRMTIGMLLESMAGKSGALYGEFYNGSPFQSNFENTNAVDKFGKLLLDKGFNYYGGESMYAGTTGEYMKCEIYIGLVYYQRLRHMISDKYQVRATGPVNMLTKQPLKGRKRHGGIRLGEMERDSLISHGCSFLLHDRLFNCSDGEARWLCKKCGSFLSVYFNVDYKRYVCKLCNNSDKYLTKVNLPHVFSYLSNELAAMNVKLTLKVDERVPTKIACN